MTCKVSLAARNEGLEYVDEYGVYRFDVALSKGVWTIYLPGSFGDSYEAKILDDAERDRIVPRLVEYLSRISWLGLPAKSYRVRTVEGYTIADLATDEAARKRIRERLMKEASRPAGAN